MKCFKGARNGDARCITNERPYWLQYPNGKHSAQALSVRSASRHACLFKPVRDVSNGLNADVAAV